MQGYIKLHRSLLENSIFNSEPFTKGQAWITLLMLANHKDSLLRIKNGEIIKIERGECGYSELALAKIFKWSRGKVKRFLNLLESEKMIQQKNTSNRTIIKIINYKDYQDDTVNRTLNDTLNNTVNEHLTIQQTDINNNDKNDNNDNNDKNDNNLFFMSEKNEKKSDPFINQLNVYFVEEYKKVFNAESTVFLSYQNRNRLNELAAEYPNIRELIPLAIQKIKEIGTFRFKDRDFTPSASWLLKADNFERVMNGEFDRKEKEKTWRELLAEKAAAKGVIIDT